MRSITLLVLSLAAAAGLPGERSARAQSVSGSEADLHLADRRLPAARLIDIDRGGRLVFQSLSRLEPVAASDIVRWGKARTVLAADFVWLEDGSWLAGQIEWTGEHTLRVVNDWFEPIDLEVEQIRGLVFRPPVSSQGFAELESRLRSANGAADVVWNLSGEDQLSGVLTLELTQPAGASMPAKPRWSLKTTAATEPLTLDRENIRAIVFSPVLRRALRSQAGGLRIDLRDGSRLNVVALRSNSDSRATVVLSDRRELASLDRCTQFVSSISRIAGSPERVVWLSSLEPAQYRFLQKDGQLTWPLGRDRDLFGQPVLVGDDLVPRCVIVHAPAQVAYRWDGRPARFLAQMSVIGRRDDLSAEIGSVNCKVLVARKGKLVEAFQSSTMRPSDLPVDVEVDLSGARLIALLVEEADQGAVGDHALWRDARLVPAQPAP